MPNEAIARIGPHTRVIYYKPRPYHLKIASSKMIGSLQVLTLHSLIPCHGIPLTPYRATEYFVLLSTWVTQSAETKSGKGARDRNIKSESLSWEARLRILDSRTLPIKH